MVGLKMAESDVNKMVLNWFVSEFTLNNLFTFGELILQHQYYQEEYS